MLIACYAVAVAAVTTSAADGSYHASCCCKLSFDNCHSRQNIFGIVTSDNSQMGVGDSRVGEGQ